MTDFVIPSTEALKEVLLAYLEAQMESCDPNKPEECLRWCAFQAISLEPVVKLLYFLDHSSWQGELLKYELGDKGLAFELSDDTDILLVLMKDILHDPYVGRFFLRLIFQRIYLKKDISREEAAKWIVQSSHEGFLNLMWLNSIGNADALPVEQQESMMANVMDQMKEHLTPEGLDAVAREYLDQLSELAEVIHRLKAAF